MDALKAKANDIILNPDYAEYLAVLKGARNGAVYGAKVRFPHALVMVFLFRSGTLREKFRLIIKATRQHARNLATFVTLYKATLLALRHLPTFSYSSPSSSPSSSLSSSSSSSSTSAFGLGPARKEGHYDTFLAGLVGGYAVFGRGRGAQSTVNQQIVMYVFARVVLALAKLSVQPGGVFGGVLEVVEGVTGGGEGGSGNGNGTTKGGKAAGRGGGRVARNAWPVFASLSWGFVMWIFRWYPDMLQPSLRSSMKYIYVNADHWDGLRNFLWHNR